MKPVTLKLLNETDDPIYFGGVRVDRKNNRQLWRFGSKYAHRWHTTKTVTGKWKTWVKWDSYFGGWDSEYEHLPSIPADESEDPGARDADDAKT